MQFISVIAACLLLASCVSQFANSYLGKTTTDIELENGKPANIVELPGDRRSYQYYWGGGTFVTPLTTTGTVNVIGNAAYMNTQTTPGYVTSSAGCLVNFITEQRNGQWVVVEATWPKRLVC